MDVSRAVQYATTTEIADTAGTESAGTSALVARGDHVHKLHPHPATFHSTTGVKVYRTAVQSISNNTVTAVNWTAEDFDSDGFHDNATNNTRLTVPSGLGGKYFVFAQLRYASNATGERQIRFHVNGSYQAYTLVLPLSGAATVFSLAAVLPLVATDYVECNAYQTSGGNLDVTHASGIPESSFGMFLIGS